MHPGWLGARPHPRPSPGGHDDSVGAHFGAVVKRNRPGAGIQPGRVHSQQPTCVEILVVEFEGKLAFSDITGEKLL